LTRLNESAYTLALKGLSLEEIDDKLRNIAEQTGLSNNEIDNAIKSGYKGANRDSTNPQLSKILDDTDVRSDNKPDLWNMLLSSVINFQWKNSTALIIALGLAEHATRRKNVFTDSKNRLCIDISNKLIETITGVDRHTVAIHFKSVLDSELFIKTDIRSKIKWNNNVAGQVLRINTDKFSDNIHDIVKSSSRDTYKVIHDLYSISRSAVLVYATLSQKALSKREISAISGVKKSAMNRALKALEADAHIITKKVGKSNVYQLSVSIKEQVNVEKSVEQKSEEKSEGNVVQLQDINPRLIRPRINKKRHNVRPDAKKLKSQKEQPEEPKNMKEVDFAKIAEECRNLYAELENEAKVNTDSKPRRKKGKSKRQREIEHFAKQTKKDRQTQKKKQGFENQFNALKQIPKEHLPQI
jgi:hypothetical protein